MPSGERAEDVVHDDVQEISRTDLSGAGGDTVDETSPAFHFDPDAPLHFSDFELMAEIGSGGMGTVYRAVQKSLGKPVAIKVLDRSRLKGATAVQRFLREGRSVAQLRHPNIVDIHGIGHTDEGGYFMVMDLVEGRDLDVLIKVKAVSFREAHVVASVAEAIEHAHRRGVIHRDLKPSNVLLDEDGRAMVTDFGLAKLLDSLHEPELSLPNEPLGTPSYMAPEQADSRRGEVGPAVDVYGLGGILYALLTGCGPYLGRSYSDVLAQVIGDRLPARPREINPEVPETLERICMRCLRKDPADRYRSASEVAEALRQWSAASGPGRSAVVVSGDRSAAGGESPSTPLDGTVHFDPARTPSPPQGAIPVDSQFYLVRTADHEFRAAVDRQDSIVLVRGARQMGKTSLLARGLMWARNAGHGVVLTDFQKLRSDDLQTPERLFRVIGEWIADDLDLDVYPDDTWDDRRSASVNFERYVRREILKKSSTPVVWGLDEVDRLFECPFRSEVFGLFRSWHNARALQPAGPWSRLTLALAYATEAHLFITDPNQSPFNVGTLIAMDDFTQEQVGLLNDRYGSPLQDDAQVEWFMEIVGGHPYLVNRGLYELAVRKMDLERFAETAGREVGVFGDHLRRLLSLLEQDQNLCGVFRTIISGGTCRSVEAFYGLRSAGFISGDSTESARPRCRLYADYFGRHLK